MVVEYIRYTIQEDQREAFVQGYEQARSSLDESANCQGYELSQCVEDQSSYILRIEWDSVEGHLQGFRRSPGFRSFFAAIQPFVNNITEMRHYTLTSVVSAKQEVSKGA